MDATSPSRPFALVGPGRAGTAVALVLAGRGNKPVAVAGRSPSAASTRRAAELLGAPVVDTAAAGRDASLVVIGTPDAAIADTATSVARSLRPGALVIHLSGASTLHDLDGVLLAQPDAQVGSIHPLQTLPSPEAGRDRLAGSWCAVEGPAAVERLARSIGLRPFRVDPAQRARYHAAACVASNHLVALLGQVERLAASAGVPFEAFLPLARATLENAGAFGPAGALTGPVARGDVDTVNRHVDALPPEERDAYRALAREALRLTGRDDASLEEALA